MFTANFEPILLEAAQLHLKTRECYSTFNREKLVNKIIMGITTLLVEKNV